MAKINLTKITPIKHVESKTININNETITVEQYLPLQAKLALMERVLNATIDTTGFLNPVKLEIFTLLEIVRTYTNISITDKMMADPAKTYDLLTMNGVIDKIIEAIPKDEYDQLFDGIDEAAKHATNYLNSFVGMLRTIQADYSNTSMNVENLLKTLGDPEQVGLVKQILDKIG